MIRDLFRDVDYHIHSNHSDGALSPREIVDRYEANGYRQIAVTDHDTVTGSWEAYYYAQSRNITVIPGIEISTRDDEGKEIHVLGYGVDLSDTVLNRAVRSMHGWRLERNEKIIKALNEMGYDVTLEEANEINGGRYVGKPVIARVLMKKGYISSVDEAFETIYRREPARGIKTRMYDPGSAIDIIHMAGGIAVFAHPMELKRRGEAAEDFMPRLYGTLDKMVARGIDGIECVHPSARPEQQELLAEFAKTNALVITAGSDFHSDDSRRKYEG